MYSLVLGAMSHGIDTTAIVTLGINSHFKQLAVLYSDALMISSNTRYYSSEMFII